MTPCPRCAIDLPDGARFCSSCGAALVGPGSGTRTSTPSRLRTAVSGGEGDRGRPAGASGPSLDRSRFVPGAVLGDRYRIVALLGRGGMGEVYRAEDLKLGQAVALKFLPTGLERDEDRLSRFLNEVRTARQVTHPNVCRVYDIGEIGPSGAGSGRGQHYLSMEYVDGEDLASLLRRIGRLSKEKAVQVARQICAGVAAAHEQGILHRDLKPANVMIDGRGRVKITDFGLAGLQASFAEGEIGSGTPAYMAPEQLAGREVTARSDIYALGLVLYELFTGKPAYEAETPTELIRMRRDSTPTDPAMHVEGFDPAVRRAILRCLEPEPGARPASALAVAAALPGGDPLAAALAAGETPSPEMVANAGGTGGLHPALAAGALALVLAGMVSVPFMYRTTRSAGRIALDLPPEALTVKAREIVREAGYEAPPVDTAQGFAYDDDYFERAWSQDPVVRWKELPTVRPAPIHFWYRQSPRYLTPGDFIESGGDPIVSPDDPKPVVSGMVGVRLDPQGRLLRFEAVPPEVDAGDATGDAHESGSGSGEVASAETEPREVESNAQPPWPALFERAGLDLAAFTPARPTWNGLGGADLRRAWVGAYPEAPDTPVRIEAGAYRGRPTLFRVVMPWTKPERMEARPWGPGEKAGAIVGVLFLTAILAGGLLLARRNLRRGRGDRRGASRLALVFFACGMLTWAFLTDHQPTFAEIGLLFQSVAWNLMGGALVWIAYVALEPYARRIWPEGLVSWSRLLQGRWRDPQVGRDILIGGLTDLTTSALTTLRFLLPIWLGLPLPQPRAADLVGLEGFRQSIGLIFVAVQGPIFVTVVTVLLLLLLRLPLRKFWAAGVALVLLLELGGILSATNPAIDVPLMLLAGGLEIFVLVRFGMLAYLSAYVMGAILWSAMYSWDLSAWYMGRSLLHAAVAVALALFAFRISLAGRPLLRRDLFDDEPAPAAGV